jgi:A/G-specific adenine glycosylase
MTNPLTERTPRLTPAGFQKSLLSWYASEKRDLPWRKTKDPYAIFVSEMMLQQTQVKTVIPYYERFLKELPDWKSLARAKPDKVLKLWEGLGYYRRARNLQAAARMILSDFDGCLPDNQEDIRRLPGVGAYSAGALLSIAYQKPHPLVDGNVIRVYSRLFLLQGNLKTGEGHKKVWEMAQKFMSPKNPGDFNQALMELGATLCLSVNPLCLLCPFVSKCQAARQGLQNELPEAAKSADMVEISMVAIYARKKGKILIKKRANDERWLKNMWEFPSAEGKTFQDAIQKLGKDLKIKIGEALQEVRHQITNHKIHLKLFKAVPLKNFKLPGHCRWVSMTDLPRFPFSSAQSRLRKYVLSSRDLIK